MKKLLLFASLSLIVVIIFYLTKSNPGDVQTKTQSIQKTSKSSGVLKTSTAQTIQSDSQNEKKIQKLPVTPKKQKLFEKLLKVTGYNTGNLKNIMLASYQNSGKLTPELKKVIEDFDFESRIKQAMIEAMDEQMIEDLIAFNQEPIVKEVNDINKDIMSDPKKIDEIKDYINDFDQSKLNETQREHLDRIIESTDAIELAKSNIKQTLRSSIMSSSQDLSFGEQEQKIAKAWESYDKSMQQRWSQFESQIKAATYYALRNLSDDQLREYSNFLEKTDMKQFNSASTHATSNVMLEFFKKIRKK